jgi:hypothetical protein
LNDYLSLNSTLILSIAAILDNEISEKEKDVIGYENGVIPINTSLLKASIGEFMQGGFAFCFQIIIKLEIKKQQKRKIFG